MHKPIYLCFYLVIAFTNQFKLTVPNSRRWGKLFHIKKFKRRFLQVYVHPTKLFPNQADGFASYIRCTSDEQISNVLKYDQIYSLHRISSQKAHIALQNTDQEVLLATKQCSGNKCCSTSRKVCSISHHGADIQPFQHNTFTRNYSSSFDTDDYKIAKQVFFYAQIALSLHRHHEWKQLHADQIQLYIATPSEHGIPDHLKTLAQF